MRECPRCLFRSADLDPSTAGACMVCASLDGGPGAGIGIAALPHHSQAFVANVVRLGAVLKALGALSHEPSVLGREGIMRVRSCADAIRRAGRAFDLAVPDRDALARALASSDGDVLRRSLRAYPATVTSAQAMAWLEHQSSFSHLAEGL